MSRALGSDKKIICRNKRARRDYAIEEVYEAGIALKGSEVKSLRDGKASLTDAYARVVDGELYLMESHISEYPFANMFNHEPKRRRKLLMKRSEIRKLKIKTEERGFTLVALALYFRGGWAKVELGLGRGRKRYDKRQIIKQRDQSRELAAARRHGRSS